MVVAAAASAQHLQEVNLAQINPRVVAVAAVVQALRPIHLEAQLALQAAHILIVILARQVGRELFLPPVVAEIPVLCRQAQEIAAAQVVDGVHREPEVIRPAGLGKQGLGGPLELLPAAAAQPFLETVTSPISQREHV